MNLTQFLISDWVWSPLAVLCAVAGLITYFAYFGWNERAGWIVASATVFLLTLMSPLAALAEGYLFCAHTAQHILLVLVVPAFALMALPGSVRMPGRIARLLHPAVSWACGVGAMWLWHAPLLCNAAAESRSVSAVQTISLLIMGGAFWWQLLAPSETQRMGPLHAMAYLFAACVACTVLGIILTFSPVTICKAYLHPVDRLGIEGMVQGNWGMTGMRDQQIGGLIMWVPMCLVYLGSIFGQLARWYAAPAETTMSVS